MVLDYTYLIHGSKTVKRCSISETTTEILSRLCLTFLLRPWVRILKLGRTRIHQYFRATHARERYASRLKDGGRSMAAKHAGDELSRCIYEIRTKIDPVVATGESP